MKSIKLYEHVYLIIDNECEEVNGMHGLWEALGWDIDNDDNAKECSSIITRELVCFGICDISSLSKGHNVIIKWC